MGKQFEIVFGKSGVVILADLLEELAPITYSIGLQNIEVSPGTAVTRHRESCVDSIMKCVRRQNHA